MNVAQGMSTAGMRVIPRASTPSNLYFVAEIAGIDLRRIGDADFDAIHRAWIAHQVLLFRDQTLSDADLIAFSRRFGELDRAPVQENGRASSKGSGIYVVSNVIEKGVAIGSLGAGEAVWHTDMSYLPDPPRRACCTRWRCRRSAATPLSATCTPPTTLCRTRCAVAYRACG